MNFQSTIVLGLQRTGKTQRQIASEIGYDKPNIITMFKTGITRVPLGRVPRLAASLDLDAPKLVRLWFEQYEPEAWSAIGPELARIAT